MEWDFTLLRSLTKSRLLDELTTVHSEIAQQLVEIAFLRAEENRGDKTRTPERIIREGDLAAMNEKKWLILKLVDESDGEGR